MSTESPVPAAKRKLDVAVDKLIDETRLRDMARGARNQQALRHSLVTLTQAERKFDEASKALKAAIVGPRQY